MSNTDDLLQPSVPNLPARSREKPWRLQSQFWVAFAGGVLAYALVAFINAERLGIEKKKRRWMAIATVAALGVLVVLWIQRPDAPDFVTFARSAREMRLIGRVAAVVLFLVIRTIQKPADTHYQVFSGGDYASLWSMGIASSLIVGTAQSALLAWIGWMANQ